jgi:lycopene cyclase domain-containing protein
MTYLQFHAQFLLPPLLVLALAVWHRRRVLPARALWAVPSLIVIAMAYTTPWDNYLVYRGVWSYGADRVVGTIGWVPVEEYLFFALQPLGVGLLLVHLLARQRRRSGGSTEAAAGGRYAARFRVLGTGAYLAGAALGVAALVAGERFTYGGLILAWACPVLAAQWWFAAPAARGYPRAFAHAIIWPTLYLWTADAIAIGEGVWSVATETSTGLSLLGLPVEEALFFLATNLLVVQGLLWLLAPAGTVILRPAAERAPGAVWA